MQKNVASQVIGAQMVSATDGSAFTGAVTVYVTGDGGTQAVGSVGSGACTHEGNGFHTYAPAQAETNYDHIAFTFIGTGAVPATVQVFTRHDSNLTHIAGSAVSTSTAQLGVNVVNFGGSAGTFSSGRPEVNTTHWGGTAVASAVVSANAIQISGDSVAADNLEAACDGTTYNIGGGAVVAASVTGAVGSVTGAVGSVTGNVGGNVTGTVGGIAGTITTLDALDTAQDSQHAATQALIGTPTDFGSGTSTIAANLQDLADNGTATYDRSTDSLQALRDRGDAAWVTATGFSTHSAADVWAAGTRTLTANTNLNDPTAAAIADAVWDEAIAGHLAAGSTGEALNGATAPTAAAVADAVWDEATAGHVSAGTFGKAAADILADTNELQTDWTNGGRLDLIVDAILADTGTDGVVVAAGSKTGYSLAASQTFDVTGNITGNLSGSVGSVSGAVGSVTGNVGGNVTGSVGSVLGGINTTSGTITTLDALDTAQDTQHSTTQGRLPAALVGGKMDADARAINSSTAAAVRLALSAAQIIPGTVDTVTNGHTPTTTEFQADDITEATDDHYNGRVIIFTSGALLGQATSISDYTTAGGIGQFTVVAMTEAPSNDDTFIII